MTPLQLSVGSFFIQFCFISVRFFFFFLAQKEGEIFTEVPLEAFPTLAPLGRLYPPPEPHILRVRNAALNRWWLAD